MYQESYPLGDHINLDIFFWGGQTNVQYPTSSWGFTAGVSYKKHINTPQASYYTIKIKCHLVSQAIPL